MIRSWHGRLAALTTLLLFLTWIAAVQLPTIGAAALLHPSRRHVSTSPPATCEDAVLPGAGVLLRGWRCRGSAPRRGTIVYLHGSADNRTSGTGVIRRFGPRGFDVIAYDSRAHGESSGNACTYGFFEKQDLRRVLDTAASGPIVLIGTSLGAAVALQETAADSRVTGVVAAETFSDLRTVASERAPFFFTRTAIERAFEVAERDAHFHVAAVSPLEEAAHVTVPVLLIHGAADSDTPPEHSRRIFDALPGSKRLIIVPGAHHNESLRAEVWDEIERWIDECVRQEPEETRQHSPASEAHSFSLEAASTASTRA